MNDSNHIVYIFREARRLFPRIIYENGDEREISDEGWVASVGTSEPSCEDRIKIRYEFRYGKYLFWASQPVIEPWDWFSPEKNLSLDWLEEKNPIIERGSYSTLVDIVEGEIDPEKYSINLLVKCLPKEEEWTYLKQSDDKWEKFTLNV